jgi:hypothetical protein
MIKSRRIRWAKHVARMREKRNSYAALVEKNPKGSGHFEDGLMKGKL